MGRLTVAVMAGSLTVPAACGSSEGGDSNGSGGVAGSGGDAGVDASDDGAPEAGSDAQPDGGPPDAVAPDAGQLKNLCDGACNKKAAAGCGAEPSAAACIASCKAHAEVYAATCATVAEAYWKCQAASATYVCSTDYGGRALEKGCVNEYIAFWACAICLPTAEYAACDVCRAEKCCPEWSSLFKSPEFKTFMECEQPCDSIACEGACLGKLGKADEALNACATSACANEC